MKAKVILYNPKTPTYTFPLGLMAIASSLDQNKYDIEIVDGRISDDCISKVAKAFDNLLCFGITVWTGEPIRWALDFSREAKRLQPDIPIVWGGWHPSILPEQCLKDSSVDIVVKGQGEVTFSELLKCLEEKRPLHNCPGIAFKENGRIINNPDRPFADISKFPPLDYSFIDPEKYFTKKGKRQLDYYSSQGCPYRCRFCADPMVFDSKWSSLNAERVVEEISALVSKYRSEEICFNDDNFFANPKRVEEICDGIISSGLNISWLGTIRADILRRLPDELLAKIKSSGCRKMVIGAESGSQKILNWIDKKYAKDDVLISAQRCKRFGFDTAFSFMSGFPHETLEDLYATVKLIKNVKELNGNGEISIYFYTVYPGSEITDYLVSHGAKLPEAVEEWIDFHPQNPTLPWIDNNLRTQVERLNFYLDYGYKKPKYIVEKLLLLFYITARWRCKHDLYSFPLEMHLVNGLKMLYNRFNRNGGIAGEFIKQFSQ
ncbi:MAG: B12-binding domain-containing radical SAM protein [Planctomycetes bacterium]|nr:B12-binding domain-containing radical SAM protein [Planctomycetota bacterium]